MYIFRVCVCIGTEGRTTRLQRHHEELLHKQELQEGEGGGVELAPILTSGRRLHDCSKHDSQQTQSSRHVATDATRPGYMIDS